MHILTNIHKLKSILEKLKHKPLLVAGLFIVLIVAMHSMYVGVFARLATHNDKTFPNVVVAGENVGGLSGEELFSALSGRLAKARVSFRLADQEAVFSAAELGVSVDEQAVFSMASDRDLMSIVRPWFTDDWRALPMNNIDQDKLEAALGQFHQDNFKQPEDASFTVKNKQLVIKESRSGFGIDDKETAASVLGHFSQSLKPLRHRLVVGNIAADIKKDDITAARRVLLDRVGKSYVLTAGNKKIAVSEATKSGWWKVVISEEGEPIVSLDEISVRSYIEKTVKSTAASPVNQVTTRYLSGKPAAVTTAGKAGRKPVNAVSLADAVIARLLVDEPYQGAVKFEEIPFKKTERTVDDRVITKTFTYEVVAWGKVKSNLDQFASLAAQTLNSNQGWSKAGIAFKRVSSGGDFTLVLSEPARVAAASSICDSYYSCRVGRYVIINDDRWRGATPSWNNAGGSLRDYRHMVVNHETGHWLGYGHRNCPGPGLPAPVMQQQSISLQGCVFNPWPTASEVADY